MNIKTLKNIVYEILKDEKILELNKIKDIAKYTEESPIRHTLLEQWNLSNCTDFNVYLNEDYQWDLVNCYTSISSDTIKRALRYLVLNEKNWNNLSYFDDYNGNGLTTLLLQSKGIKDLSYYNNVDFQIKSLNNICDKFGFDKPYHDKDRLKKYDVYFSLECIEHFKKPYEYIDEVIKYINDEGYLIITFNGFNWTPDLSIGHFDTYINDDGKSYSGKQIKKFLYKRLESHGFKLIKSACWNSNPQIFKKNK